MQAIVYGTNYEGAHHRRIESSTDGRDVKVLLDGTEQNIVNYIRDNFGYGMSYLSFTDPEGRDYTTLAELKKGYELGEEAIWDGCGGVYRVLVEGQIVIDNTELQLPSDPETGSEIEMDDFHAWYDLGTVMVDHPTSTIVDLVHQHVWQD